ncbi:Monovalent cation/H+ antiporter subunit A OS=Rhodanobacter lindaniclasticus OX=75310 GN=B1991_06510 PE=4 SV=1 [Rhodanobacter lindaniclasticus]
MPDNALPSVILCLPFAVAAVTWLMRERGHNRAAWLMTGTALLGLALSLWLTPAIFAGGVLRQTIPWAGTLGLDLGCGSTASPGCSCC